MPSAGALRAGRAVIELSLLTKPIEKGLRALQAKTRAISASFARVSAVGFGGGGAGGGLSGLRNLFVGSAAGAALLWPVKMAANIEVAAAGLATFTGGADNAKALLLDLQKFSAVSLIPFEELTTGASLLIRYGIATDQAAASTKSLAVLAAGSADEFQKLTLAFAQVASAGRLQGEEMRQFKNTAFNPLREIAERTGETMLQVKDRMEAGGVSFNEVAASLQAATGAGGRFHGLLEAISKTLIGQMKKALATFKMSVLPLGDEMLAPFTKMFRAINGIIPAFGLLIKNNIRFVQTALLLGSAIAFAAAAFTALGLSMTLISVASAGFAATFGVIAALFSAVVSPIGAVVGGLALLAGWFFTSTEAGRSMVNHLGAGFARLEQIAKMTFQGIADSLAGGEIMLAAKVLWTGLKLAWLEGTENLRIAWASFKNDAVAVFTNLVFDVQSLWVEMIAFLKNKLTQGTAVMGDLWDLLIPTNPFATVEERLAQGEERAARSQQRHANVPADLAGIEAERKAKLAAIEENRKTATGTSEAKKSKEVQEAADAAGLAATELDRLRTAAAAAAKKAQEDQEDPLGGALAPAFAGMAGVGKDNFKPPDALFDASLSRQIFGQRDDIEREQLRVQKQIAKNTAKGGGIPVI